MRVTVTGGAGLIGTAVVRMLLSRGHDVSLLDRQAMAHSEPTSDGSATLRRIVADCRDPLLVESAVDGSDVVIHLAAAPAFLSYERSPTEEFSSTVVGFMTVLESMKRARVRRLVHASTSALYEGNELPYVETMPIKVRDLKSFSKKVNEGLAELYAEKPLTSVVALRPFSVYGEWEVKKGPLANVVSLFAWAMAHGHRPIVWGDGTQTRDFVFVEDVARAFCVAAESDLPAEVINVGTGVETSFNRLIALINRTLATDLEPTYLPVPLSIYAGRLQADTTLAAERLGFSAQVSIDDGVALVVNRVRSSLGLLEEGGWDHCQEGSEEAWSAGARLRRSNPPRETQHYSAGQVGTAG
jgi:nucleoside-diphosphate-sugar epimerase